MDEKDKATRTKIAALLKEIHSDSCLTCIEHEQRIADLTAALKEACEGWHQAAVLHPAGYLPAIARLRAVAEGKGPA